MSRYQSYPEYKDSGVEWLGEMPSEWSAVRLKLVANINMGQSPNSEDCNLDGHGVAFLQGNAEFGRVNPKEKQYCPIPRKVARAGELLFSVRAPVGALNIADKEYGIGRGLCSICSSSYINSSYLWWVLPSYKYQLDAIATGSTFEAVSAEQVENLYFKLPSIVEQSQISTFLEHEITKIDNLIKKQQQLIELLKEKRQAVISHAVTKGLNSDVSMKDSGVEWFGMIPVHWSVSGLKRYLSSIVDYRGKTPNKTDDGVLLVTARNIKKGALDYTLSQEFISPNDYSEVMSRGVPKIGDVLFTTEAPLGEVANVDNVNIALAQRIIKFRGRGGILDNYFLKYLMMSNEFQQSLNLYSSGSTAKGIKAERFVYLRKLLPPIEEQFQIVTFLNMETKKIDTLIEKAESVTQLIQERRTALISAAVTGKIDVRNWVAPTSDTEVNREPQEATA